MNNRPTVVVAMAILVALSLTVPVVGMVAADDHAPHEVSIKTTELTSGSEQLVEITVTNPAETDMVSPIVEVPLRSGLSVADSRRSTEGGTEFVDGVSVENGSMTEDRTAFIDGSSFRDTDAVYIEGVEVPAGESYTYAVPITVSGSSEVTLESDVRPLNNEGQNIRVSRSINPTSPGTINASLSNGNADITISGSAIDTQSETGTIERDIPGGESYDVSTTLSTIDETVMFSDLQVAEFETATIQFTNPSDSGTVEPTVIGQTGSQAEIVGESVIRSTDRGTAETRTTQTVKFDLLIGSGETVVAVGAQSDLPMTAVDSTSGINNLRFANDSEPGVAVLNTSGSIDSTASVTLEGRFVGDVTGDSAVNSADATAIADNVAAGDTESLTGYADVSDDDEVSAIDAMQIQQYTEGNRTTDYSAIDEEI